MRLRARSSRRPSTIPATHLSTRSMRACRTSRAPRSFGAVTFFSVLSIIRWSHRGAFRVCRAAPQLVRTPPVRSSNWCGRRLLRFSRVRLTHLRLHADMWQNEPGIRAKNWLRLRTEPPPVQVSQRGDHVQADDSWTRSAHENSEIQAAATRLRRALPHLRPRLEISVCPGSALYAT